MLDRLSFACVMILIFALNWCNGLEVAAQESQGESANSIRFEPPIPVTLRKSTNSLMQGMLVGINENSISFMNLQGRTFEFANNTVKFVRSLDGSFSYSPGKDNAAEVIQKARQLQAARGAAGGTTGPGTAPGAAPGAQVAGTTPAGHGQVPATNAIPFTVIPTSPNTTTPNGPHTQPMPGSTYIPPTTTPSATPYTTPMGSHTQMPPTTPTTSTMPMGSHMQSPSSMPMSSHTQMPGMPGMVSSPMTPQLQTMYEYECSKCRHRFTSPVEIKAGHRCTKCGIVWGQVKDEHGNVMSSSPAARIGGGVGVVALIIGVIVAIVRKSQSA